MRGCLQIIAVFVGLIFVVVTVLAVTLLPFVDIVTNRDSMTRALSGLDGILVGMLPGLVTEQLEMEVQAWGLPGAQIDETLVEAAMGELLPPGWVDAQVETAVNNFYDGLESGQLEEVEFVIDARPVLQQMRGPGGQQLAAAVVSSLPDCTEPLDLSDFLSDNFSIPSCVPVEIPRQLVVEQLHAQVVGVLDENPSLLAQYAAFRIPIMEGVQLNQPQAIEARQQFARASQILTFIIRWGWLLWGISLICLLTIVVLAVRSLSAWGHWWGWLLMLTGGVLLLLAWVLPMVMGRMVETAAVSQFNLAYTPPMRELVHAVGESMTQLWRSRVFIQAGLLTGIGIVLTAVGFFARGEAKP